MVASQVVQHFDMYINPSYVHKLAAQLDAPITSYFDGACVIGPAEAPKTPNVIVEEEIKSAIESMKGLHDMPEPWVEGSSYKSDKVSFFPFFDFGKPVTDFFFDSMRNWNSCTT